MKTVLTSIITSIVTVIIVFFVIHAIWGGGECIFSDDDDDKECTEYVKKDCDKRHHETASHSHEMMMKHLVPLRAEFDEQLSDEEKASIEAIQDKFEDAGFEHEKMCGEGVEKFQEQHKEDIAALLAIAGDHQKFFDDWCAKMRATEKCEHAEGSAEVVAEGSADVVKDADKCPEAAKCKEATEKCKGEQAKTPEAKEKCEKAEAECKKECEEKLNTFKIHFLLLDDDGCEHEDA